jgi:MFS family permease
MAAAPPKQIPEAPGLAPGEIAHFPPGLHNAYLFAIFNALSFQIILNSPMVLYAKSLGASATVLGIIVGMWPLLVIFQIPAAQHISRIGYKRFVYAGWGTRVCFIFAMALVPLTGRFLNQTTQLALLLMLLFGFNLSRGISSAGWLPWISSLIPEQIRGRYLARDAACVNMASGLTFLIAAACLGPQPNSLRFALLFGFSAVMGAISLGFLKKIPDVAPPAEDPAKGKGGVPWLAMLRFPPFRKLLRTVIAWSTAYGGMTAFTVAFLKSEIGMNESTILLLNSVMFLGGLSSLWLLGSRLDHLGSKPVLTFCFVMWLMISLAWGALAGKMLTPQLILVLALEFLMGLCAALVAMANVRLAMAIVPVMGRNHFFALYSVIGSLMLGVAPVLWGLLIDLIGTRAFNGPHFEWNRYSAFFIAVAIVFGITLSVGRRLDEPKAASMDALLRELLLDAPQRVLVRIWPKE